MRMKVVGVVVFFLATLPVARAGLSSYTKNDLPKSDWVSFEDGSSFMPAADPELMEHMREYHQQKSRSLSSGETGYMDYFVDGSETFWPEGAQAWRLVGYYIDCYNVETGYKGRRQRNLHQNEVIESEACLRYLLWAAYVDVEYEGGGIGEYQYWDASSGSWDTSACMEVGNERCAKMDCHLKGSNHFRLLGFFKEPNFGQFYEQLFKHQGICLWDEDEYSLMQNLRELWPVVCTNSYDKDEKGNYLYFDLRPVEEGDVSIGLYTDYRCSVDYTGGKKKVADVIQYYESYGKQQNNNNDNKNKQKNKDGSILDLVSYMDKWNDAMEIYKQCQPCKAYNLNYEFPYNDDATWYYYHNKKNNPNNGYYYDDDGSKEDEHDYSDDDSRGHFLCYDDAGYTNVNQCMKFATKTKLMAATFRDVMIGASQGTIKELYVGDILVYPRAYLVTGTNWSQTDFVAIGLSSIFFLASAWMMHRSWRRATSTRRSTREYRTPLVD